MIRNVFFVFGWSMCLAHSIPGYGQYPGRPSVWNYFPPPLIHRTPSHQTPMEAMVDLTNNLAVAILQDHSYSRGNFAFSPYGVASVLVVLYEGARGESARQIHTAVGFPPDRDTVRIGFRDIHRHLMSYFSHEGYLSGISLNKDRSSLKPEYKRVLRFYGYDVGQPSEEDDVGVENSITQNSSPKPSMTSTAVRVPTEMINTTTIRTTISSTLKVEESTKLGLELTNTTMQSTTTESVTQTIDSSSQFSTDAPDKNMTTITSTEGTTVSLFEAEQTESTAPSTPTTVVTTVTEKVTTPTLSFDTKRTETTAATTEITDTQKNTEQTTEHKNEKEVKIDLKPQENTTPGNETLENTDKEEEEKEDEEKEEDDEEKEEDDEEKDEDDEEKDEDEDEEEEKEEKDSETSETKPEVSEKPVGTAETTTNPTTDSPAPENQSTAMRSTVMQTTVTQPTVTQTAATQSTDFDNGMLIPQAGDNQTTTSEGASTTGADQTTSVTTETTSDTTSAESNLLKRGRHRKSDSSHISAKNSIDMSQNDEGASKRIRGMINSRTPKWLHSGAKKNTARTKRTVTDYLKSPQSADLSLQLQNGMYDTQLSRNTDLYGSLPRFLFLVDGAVDTPVPMMTYTNVFPFAYIPRLRAKAMEFPLDDVRYKLLLLLPVERRGLRQLVYDLTEFPLSDVLTAMQPMRIKTTIPTFMVEGFVILTPSLQKLGIRDVFDPRKADLSGMSLDPELYVRNVEQSVTVVIRNYVEILDIQTRTMAARQMEREFEATHPFLYFVMDTATNVSLMAGQVLDPLSSRIY